MNYLRFCFVLLLSASACDPYLGTDRPTPQNGYVDGYKPVYGEEDIIANQAPRSLSGRGKIYIKDTLLYVMQKSEGIHVINNANPSLPIPLTFITLPGVSEMSIKESYLYADSFNDLVVLDISTIGQVKEINRSKGAFPGGGVDFSALHPSETGYFECPDSKRVVKAWVKARLYQPKCYNGNGNLE